MNLSLVKNYMQRIVLDGTPPSKKNGKRIVRRGNRTMLLSQAGYDSWERSTALQMAASLRPVQRAHVAILFAFADRRRRDLTNAAEGIMDALVRAAILPDDSWKPSLDYA